MKSMLKFITLILLLILVTSDSIHRRNHRIGPKKENKSYENKVNLHPEENFSPELKAEIDNLIRISLFENFKPYRDENSKTTIGQFSKEKEKEFLEERKKKLRGLDSTNILSDVGFFNLTQDKGQKSTLAHKFLMSKLSTTQTKFILYPYNFHYKRNYHDNIIEEDTTEGGVFSLDPDSLDSGNFEKIINITDAQIGHAKSLYDGDIGILSLSYQYESQEIDLFTESSKYCSYFVSYLNKISNCLITKAEYETFKKKYPSRGVIQKINNTLLLNNTLLDENDNLIFKLLIIPDYYPGLEDVIKSYLTDKGIEIIKKFREKGGHIIASGKSGYLLELFGILPSGTYDNSKTIKGDSSTSNLVTITGCEPFLGKSPTDQTDYFKQLICLSPMDSTYLIGAFPLNTIPSGYETLLTITNKNGTILENIDGVENYITDTTKTFPYIIASNEDQGKGRIFLVNGNPLSNMNYIQPVRNFILYALTKNILFDFYMKFVGVNGEDLPIPGGEEKLQLSSTFRFYNLFDNEISDMQVDFLVPNDVLFVEDPNENECEIIYDSTTYSELNKGVNISQFYRCKKTTISSLSILEKKFKIEITNASVTQKGTNIPLIYAMVTYKENDATKTIDYGFLYAQAQTAALLRPTFNVDPAGQDPLKGIGNFFDNILDVENKEASIANNVKMTTVIPLICPVVEDSDSTVTTHRIPIYDAYFRKHNYTYGWKNVGAYRPIDFIDYAELAGDYISFSNDWDTPVRISKVTRTALQDMDICPSELFEPASNQKYTRNGKSVNPEILLKEIYYADSDKFYERAATRTAVFIDTTSPEGASAHYGGAIPDDLVDPTHNDRTKFEFVFSRVDILFYDVEEYRNPLPHNYIISVDKYNQDSAEKISGAIGIKWPKKRLYVEGHYDSDKPEYETLKPGEYTNLLRQYSDYTIIDPTTDDGLKKLTELTEGNTTLGHYLVPLNQEGVESVDNILDFVHDYTGSKTGYHKDYKLIKFIYAHSMKLILKPELTRMGGKVVITLPSGIYFNASNFTNELVSISADSVSFYQTEYDNSTGKITLYFKRGLNPDESYGKDSKCEIYFEKLSCEEVDIKVTVEVYEMKYDLGVTGFQSYTLISTESEVDVKWRAFWQYPCLYMNIYLQRTSNNQTTTELKEYESLSPYSHIGLYFQELKNHAYIWCPTACHHVTLPGIQLQNLGYSVLSHVGTSFIPFDEYVSHGKSLIPGSTETARMEWDDVWGRRWSQNLRSLYPATTPAPGPVKNFMMSTTFELISANDKEERLLEWPSDESVYIRQQMKFISNYEKWFIPVACKDNELPFLKQSASDVREDIFIDYDVDDNNNQVKQKEYVLDNLSCGTNKDECYLQQGISSSYGKCYAKDGSFLSGQAITSDIFDKMEEMMKCAQTDDSDQMSACAKNADSLQLPLLKKRDDSVTDNSPHKTYNYAPLIEDYYPDGYITQTEIDMWDLTHTDYEDNAFMKGYPYRYDDNIPGVDIDPTANPAVYKPNNLMAFPIYKGLGYSITYDPNYKLSRFPNFHGWWSDQLQNKDHTLIAGQEKSNIVSVGKEELLKSSDWINARDIKETTIPEGRLKNIYVCKFNQHRVKVSASQKKYSYPANVYQNNVIPVDPTLDENDQRLTNFDCTGENQYQYTKYNISLFNNRLNTGNIRDWLYFALNLRENAKEDVNIITRLDPIENTKYEGLTKVQDGGMFTYWNPALGLNDYQIINNNVNIVIGKRVDFVITQAVYPLNLFTFNTPAYQLFTIEDPSELLREYTISTYTNNYGFGDATTTVFVGGTDSTSCKVNPGEFTYAKITLSNNAGFDWIMKEGAIEQQSTGTTKATSFYNMMTGNLSNIMYPSAFNFLKLEIPEEIEDYINISIADNNIDVAPQFFDFTNINVQRIRDGFKGEYSYKIEVKKDFPVELQGKMLEIKVNLVESYFEQLPGPNDPTGIHDYQLSIPSIKFGVPLQEGDYKGKIFYVYGQGQDISFNFTVYKYFQIQEVKSIIEDDLPKINEAILDEDKRFDKLEEVWNSLQNDQNCKGEITYTEQESDNNQYKTVTVNLTKAYPLLPFEIIGKPYQQKINILFKTLGTQAPVGSNKNLLKDSNVQFSDGRKNKEKFVDPYSYYNNVYGPWISVGVSFFEVEWDKKEGKYVEIQGESEFSIGESAIYKYEISIKNMGSGDSYDNNFYINFTKYAVPVDYKEGEEIQLDATKSYTYDTKSDADNNIMYVKYGGLLRAGEVIKLTIYLEIQINESKRRLRRLDDNTKSMKVINGFTANLCKTNDTCTKGSNNFGVQIIDTNSIIYFKTKQISDTKNKNKSFPIWIIILIVLIILLIAASILIYIFRKKIFNKTNEAIPADENNKPNQLGIGDVRHPIDPDSSSRFNHISKFNSNLDFMGGEPGNHQYPVQHPQPQLIGSNNY